MQQVVGPNGVLNHAEYAAYCATLATTHFRRVQLAAMTLEGRRLRVLEPMILDGSTITVDANAPADAPTRIATVTFLDPSRSLAFEPDTAGSIPVHRSRMLQVHDLRFVPGVGWVRAIPFTGPMVDYDRTGGVVSIVGHGKEVQAQGARWSQRPWPAKTPKGRIIRTLLVDAGETEFDIPPMEKRTTPKRLVVTRYDISWAEALKLAESMNLQLFYCGGGVAILRKPPTRPVFTFTAPMVLSDVAVDRQADGIRNVFIVTGGKPKGSKKKVSSGPVWLPAWHPNSSRELARNGAPLRLPEREENDQYKTDRDCTQRALRMRDRAIGTPVSYGVDLLPVAHLDERDPVKVVAGDGTYRLSMDQWALPLTGEALRLGDIKKARGRSNRASRSQGRRGRRTRGDLVPEIGVDR